MIPAQRAAALIRISVLGLCMAVAACDRPTGVTLTVDAGRPIEDGCIPGLERAVSPIDEFRTLYRSEGSTSQEVSILRASGMVNVHRSSASAHFLQIMCGWIGPQDERVERECAALLVDVRDAVLRTCGMDPNSVRLSYRCGGPICEVPELAPIRIGPDGREIPMS
jgi:hypothetical protein